MGYDFKKKKNEYFKGRHGVSSYTLTTQVLNEEEWTPELVEKRQRDLTDLLAERWHLIGSS